jgi:glycosyltransferase involved in cell wall biosynthesis
MGSHDVTVVICTYNRCSDLAFALDSVLAQRDPPRYEVIVVDNNSTDATAAVVHARRRANPHLRYVFEPRQGLPRARNTGITNATSSIIAFTDDDIVVADDWVRCIYEAFQRYPKADCVGGPVLPRWPRSGKPDWFSELQTSPLALQNKGQRPVYVNQQNAAPCLIGANFAFRKAAFAKSGLFDPGYTRTQDRELQLRLWKAGGLGVYVPDIVTYVDVPTERLTKAYFRLWYRRAGRFHSRMRLLEVLDAAGQLVPPPPADSCWLGVPPYIYRQLGKAIVGMMGGFLRRDESRSLYHENKVRYLFNYIAQRWRDDGATVSRAVTDLVRLFRYRRRSRSPSSPPVPGAGAGEDRTEVSGAADATSSVTRPSS